MSNARVEAINIVLEREYPGWKLTQQEGRFPELRSCGGAVIEMGYAEIHLSPVLEALSACGKEIEATR